MDAPLIGISTYGRNFENHFSLPAEYVEAVRRTNGIPVLMAPGEPHLEEWLETVDALIISGGVDVEPKLYDGPGHETVREVEWQQEYLAGNCKRLHRLMALAPGWTGSSRASCVPRLPCGTPRASHPSTQDPDPAVTRP